MDTPPYFQFIGYWDLPGNLSSVLKCWDVFKLKEKIKVRAALKKKAIKEIVDFGLMNPDEDAPLNKLTIKDIAALWLKQPVSDKEWLNKLIKNAK